MRLTTLLALTVLIGMNSAALGQGSSPPVSPAAASNRMVELKTSFTTTKEITITAGSFLIVTPSEDIEVPLGTTIDDEEAISETTLSAGEEFEVTLIAPLKLPKRSKLGKKSKVAKPTWDLLNQIKFGKTVYAPSAAVKAVDVDRSMRSVNQKLDAITQAVSDLGERVDSLDKRVGKLEAHPTVVRIPPPTSPETARPLPPPPAAAVIYNVDSCGQRIYSSDGGRNWYYCR
ncbi:MAG: hypothetical protein KBD00_01960 [Candidatus Peribacteraceae bacterium]|nr:hypothetical protein [Candidatus Peribacteraceae bacterium]